MTWHRGSDYPSRHRTGSALVLGPPLRPASPTDLLGSRLGCAYLGARAGDDSPKNRRQAMSEDRSGWTKAELSELDNHSRNESWTYVDRSTVPTGRRVIRLIWVYKKKRDGRLKARLCVQGCSQQAGVDYDQTYCAAMRSTSLRTLASIAARLGLEMYRWDFVSAYLQGELEDGEVVYCTPPQGHEGIAGLGADGRPRLCCVQKPIYGMAQAGRRWQRSLFPWLKEWGLSQSQSDPCVFHCTRTVDTPAGPRQDWLILGCYVDDLFILPSSSDEHSLYTAFIAALEKRWNIEDEGEVSDLLNVEITRDARGVHLRQASYIDRLLATYLPDGIPDSFRACMPPAGPELPDLAERAVLSKSVPPQDLLRRYQSLVGALLYCSGNTRPDIALAVGQLCRAMAYPTPELYAAAERVLQYLGRHRDVGLTYDRDQSALLGYSDSDWATRHSTSGAVFLYSRAAISWASKKQPCVALSSCEAEIIAASEAAKEATYLRAFLNELGFSESEPTQLAMDNQAGRDLAYNPEHQPRTKHIDRRHFFIREKVEDFTVTVPFVRSADNLADFFTKPLAAKPFFAMRDIIMNVRT